MESVFEWVLVFSPLLLVVPFLQRKEHRPLAMFCVAVLIGGLTVIFASILWGGPGDAAMGRGLLVFYGFAICTVAALIAAWMLMGKLSRAGATSTHDEESGRD